MRVIKKYPNRRLYDTEKSSYITLNEVHELVRQGGDFKVVDAGTGEDITRSILIQIIIEQEGGETPIFTTDMLTKFIRFYDDAAHGVFGEFLERNLQIFTEQQKQFQQQMGGLVSPLPRIMQDVAEMNLNLWKDMQQRFFDLASGGVRPSSDKKSDEMDAPDTAGPPKNKKNK